jgi:glutathione synthase/RimK-type ligase-like ATP-grasp enzyme
MILVLGSSGEQMIRDVHQELVDRSVAVHHIELHDVPGTVATGLRPDGDGFFLLSDGTRVELAQVRSVYHRVGFADTEVFEEYSADEAQFAKHECHVTLTALLNSMHGLVVNRPSGACTNASKPYQINLISRYGFHVPRTVVTNVPEVARDFFSRMDGAVIYKSISYMRSIVQVMQEADLYRLESVRTCPIQLQEQIEGYDLRVHVVGDKIFACSMQTDASDYRYDKTLEVKACEIPGDIAAKCVTMARGLGLTLAGIDLRKTPDGRWFCFEVNPSPAFSWYENRSGQPLAAAVCDVLCEADK